MGTAHTDSVTVLRAMLGGGEGEWLGVRMPDIGLADDTRAALRVLTGFQLTVTRLAMTRGVPSSSTRTT